MMDRLVPAFHDQLISLRRVGRGQSQVLLARPDRVYSSAVLFGHLSEVSEPGADLLELGIVEPASPDHPLYPRIALQQVGYIEIASAPAFFREMLPQIPHVQVDAVEGLQSLHPRHGIAQTVEELSGATREEKLAAYPGFLNEESDGDKPEAADGDIR